MIWVSLVWWLIALGIIVHVSSQQELMRVRYFAYLQDPTTQITGRVPFLVPIEQVLEMDNRQMEPDFTGMTWDPRHRMWIAWKNGEPVSANALVGE
jgi:hypothetical protein